jgi:flagellar biogenesis protein FliO
VDIKPWHILLVIALLALAGFAAYLVRAFQQGRRG